MDYHAFKKPKIKNGKKIYKWYYYYAQNGKQIQKACKNYNNCSDAESYIRSLPPLQNKSTSITVKDTAQTMFLTGSSHVSVLIHKQHLCDKREDCLDRVLQPL